MSINSAPHILRNSSSCALPAPACVSEPITRGHNFCRTSTFGDNFTASNISGERHGKRQQPPRQRRKETEAEKDCARADPVTQQGPDHREKTEGQKKLTRIPDTDLSNRNEKHSERPKAHTGQIVVHPVAINCSANIFAFIVLYAGYFILWRVFSQLLPWRLLNERPIA